MFRARAKPFALRSRLGRSGLIAARPRDFAVAKSLLKEKKTSTPSRGRVIPIPATHNLVRYSLQGEPS